MNCTIGQHTPKNPLMEESDSGEIENSGWPLNDIWGKIYAIYRSGKRGHFNFDFNQHLYMYGNRSIPVSVKNEEHVKMLECFDYKSGLFHQKKRYI